MGLCRNKMFPDLREQPPASTLGKKQKSSVGCAVHCLQVLSASLQTQMWERDWQKLGMERERQRQIKTQSRECRPRRRKGKKERDQKEEKQENGEKEERWGAQCLWFPFTPHHRFLENFSGYCCQAVSFSRQEREKDMCSFVPWLAEQGAMFTMKSQYC